MSPVLEWKGATGVITADMIQKELPDYKENMFYACGPPPMVEAMEKLIASMGITKRTVETGVFHRLPDNKRKCLGVEPAGCSWKRNGVDDVVEVKHPS